MNEPRGTGATPSDGRGQVIVLAGPPGAGKSTVARLLADRRSPSVHLHCDDFWHYIVRGIRSLCRQFADVAGYEAHTLDSTHLTAEATAEQVERGIAEGVYVL